MYDVALGFNNTGAICWMNSLLQAIISCKSLCQYFLSSDALKEADLGNTAKELSTLIRCYREGSGANESVKDKSLDVLKALIRDLKDKKKTINWMESGQQSCSEGLVLILEMLSNKKIDALFYHIYEIKTICNNTNENVSTVRDTNNIFYLWEFTEQKLLESSLEEMILSYTEEHKEEYIPDDYKEKHKEGYTYKKVYKLRRIPNIVIIALNRYKSPRNSNLKLPLEFTIPSNKGTNMVYTKIAEIDHLGSLHSGGHYVCRCKRNDKVFLFNDISFKEYKFGTLASTYLTFYEMI